MINNVEDLFAPLGHALLKKMFIQVLLPIFESSYFGFLFLILELYDV